MKTSIILVSCIIFFTFSAASGQEIRRTNFQNYTFNSTSCAKDLGQDSNIRLRGGRFRDGDFLFEIAGGRAVYGDVDGDGTLDAVVPLSCAMTSGTARGAEVHVFTSRKGRVSRLVALGLDRMERDYKRFYRNGFLVSIVPRGTRVSGGRVQIDFYAEGSNASPKYVSTLEYSINRGGRAAMTGKPKRRLRK